MLKAVYEGKGYDVINDGSISQEDLIKAIEEHDTIIMLGHGTPDGLLAVDKKLGFIGYLTVMQTSSRRRKHIRCGVTAMSTSRDMA